jgi:acetyltransferase
MTAPAPSLPFTLERIEEITPALEPELRALLEDTVASGASVGFVHPISAADNAAYWRDVSAALQQRRKIVLVARAQGRVAGSVQLELAHRTNALHRATVQALMVAVAFRRHGIARALMAAIEAEAAAAKRTLLVLDTRAGDAADGLYRRLGYSLLGVVPGYARSSSGVYHGTAFFYKHLA